MFGMNEIECLMGVCLMLGGVYEGFGMCNVLLGFSNWVYFEIFVLDFE